MENKVIILMSTYNGEKYLEEQLDSILNQTHNNIKIIIRDDGSRDKTIEILNKYKSEYSNIDVIFGENLGPAKSFLYLIKNTKEESEYFAFSDQDDVWDFDKIETALKQLEQKDGKKPLLYFSETRLVDEHLNVMKNIRKIFPEKINLGNAFIENIATGCTCVFNHNLKELLTQIEYEDIKSGYMHDSLAYRICFATGEISYDPIPHISYRQHENNVIGNSNNMLDKFKKRKNSIAKTLNLRSNMARYIYEKFNDKIAAENKKVIKNIAYYKENLISKLKIFLNYKITRMSFIDDLFYRIAIILGKV